MNNPARREVLAASGVAVTTVLFAGLAPPDSPREQITVSTPEESPTAEGTPDGTATEAPTGTAEGCQPDTTAAESRSCRTDLEREPDGDIDFEYDGLSFETEDDAVEFSRDGDPFVDLDVGRDRLDLVIVTDGSRLELETEDDTVSVDGSGRPVEFENDEGDVSYAAPPIDVTWDGRDLDIDSPVSLEWEPGTFEFRHDVSLSFDARTNDFEFECSPERPRSCEERR